MNSCAVSLETNGKLSKKKQQIKQQLVSFMETNQRAETAAVFSCSGPVRGDPKSPKHSLSLALSRPRGSTCRPEHTWESHGGGPAEQRGHLLIGDALLQRPPRGLTQVHGQDVFALRREEERRRRVMTRTWPRSSPTPPRSTRRPFSHFNTKIERGADWLRPAGNFPPSKLKEY